jgi:hypothetical protein
MRLPEKRFPRVRQYHYAISEPVLRVGKEHRAFGEEV